jgi:arginine decarboxylase
MALASRTFHSATTNKDLLMDRAMDPEIRATGTQRAMRIHMSIGIGDGPTTLAAFDAALVDAGVANYNLLCLSSVIPPNARIVRARHTTLPDDYGRRLYVVMSQMREDCPGRSAHAGIGWVQQESSGRGLFVELHDSDRTRLERDLHATLDAMRASREVAYGRVHTEIASASCLDRPVCALVVAVYACEPW